MQCSLPPDITPFLADAIPILHRVFLRMGSFPYQNDPEKLLVLGVLRTACILFTHEPEDLAEGHPFLVIIFQSMAGLDPDKAQENTNPKPRDEDDDYHLKEALFVAKNRFRDPDNPSVWLPGLENPPSSHFPSSWSKNFDQSIPTLEFRSFLRLVIFLNMYHSHMETGNIASLHLQVEKVTNCMLAAFQPSAAGIIWDHFNQVIGNHMVRLSTSFPFPSWLRLLIPTANFISGYLSTLGPLYSIEASSRRRLSISRQNTSNITRCIHSTCPAETTLFCKNSKSNCSQSV